MSSSIVKMLFLKQRNNYNLIKNPSNEVLMKRSDCFLGYFYQIVTNICY